MLPSFKLSGICITEVGLMFIAALLNKLGLRRTTLRKIDWAIAVINTASILRVQSVFFYHERWIHVPPFFGVDPNVIAASVCVLLATAVIERAFLRIGIMQHGEMPFLGAAVATPIAFGDYAAGIQTSGLVFLASLVVIFKAIRYVMVSSPARLPEPGAMNTALPDDIGPQGSVLAFMRRDSTLVRLVVFHVGTFFFLSLVSLLEFVVTSGIHPL